MAAIKWTEFRTPEEVEGALLQRLPVESSAADVDAFLSEAGLEHSDPIDNTVHASAPARGRRPWVSAKWLMTFTLQDGVLIEISVTRGLTGP